MTQSIESMIEVLQAHKEGKRIQCRYLLTPEGEWSNTVTPVFNFKDYMYRIKPAERDKVGELEKTQFSRSVRRSRRLPKS